MDTLRSSVTELYNEVQELWEIVGKWFEPEYAAHVVVSIIWMRHEFDLTCAPSKWLMVFVQDAKPCSRSLS